ncbi:MAG: hypothetical protein WEA36_00765 [Balneolaceae bacterium]
MKPKFKPGKNIAMKVPTHEYEATVSFYRDLLGFQEIPVKAKDQDHTIRFQFGEKVLWVDKVPSISQAETWFEIVTDDVEGASDYLTNHGCSRRDEIEPLPDDFDGFWISSPSNIIHLVTKPENT